MSESVYTPSKWQQEVHALQANEILGAGSAGVGKTRCLLADPLAQIITEHNRFVQTGRKSTGWALHLRRQLTELKQTINVSQTLFRSVDPGAKYDAGEFTWEFSSGYHFQFGHCKDADDHQKYLSSEFCLAAGQRVVMADGSLRAIEDVVAGEFVMTLEGAKRVLATWDTGVQHCSALDVLHPTTGDLIGTQLQPTTHPVLLSPTDESLLPGSQGIRQSAELVLSNEPYWQDYESRLCGARVSREKRVSTIDEGSCFVASDGSRTEASQLPALSCRPVLHEPSFLSAIQRAATLSRGEQGTCVPSSRLGLASSQPQQCSLTYPKPSGPGALQYGDCGLASTSCGDEDVLTGSGTATGFEGHCSPCPRLRDAQPPHAGECGRARPLPPAGAVARIQSSLHEGAISGAPSHGQNCADSSYPHFYSEERRPRKEDVRIGYGTMRYAGRLQTFDLTVEDANHYIGEYGVVNIQTHIAFDELSTFSKEQYDGITSRLRSSDAVLKNMLRIVSMSNPGVSPGSDPHWVRKRFVDPAPEGKRLIRVKLRRGDGTEFYRTRIYWPGKLSDNPNPEFKRQYEETLLDKPAHIRKAYLEGDWYFAPGSFFGEDFDPKLHVVSVFKPPSDWPVFRSMDWGYKSKGVIHWYAMDPDGDLYVFDEYVFRERSDATVAEDVKRIEKRHGLWGLSGRSRITGPADTQLWEERGDSAKRKVDVFMDLGVPWVQADKRSRRDNAERVLKRLKDHKGGVKNPGIMFMSNCKEIITSLPQLRTDKLDPEEPEKGGNDHAYDSVSYGVAYASHGANRIHVVTDNGDELDDDEEPARPCRFGYGI